MRDTAKGPMPETVKEFRGALIHALMVGTFAGALIMVTIYGLIKTFGENACR